MKKKKVDLYTFFISPCLLHVVEWMFSWLFASAAAFKSRDDVGIRKFPTRKHKKNSHAHRSPQPASEFSVLFVCLSRILLYFECGTSKFKRLWRVDFTVIVAATCLSSLVVNFINYSRSNSSKQSSVLELKCESWNIQHFRQFRVFFSPILTQSDIKKMWQVLVFRISWNLLSSE